MGSLKHVNNNSSNLSLCQVHNTDFSRADQCLIFVIMIGLQPARELLFRFIGKV